MKYIWELWFRNKLIYSFKSKKRLLSYWEVYKKENNIEGEKGLIKKVEIIPFRG